MKMKKLLASAFSITAITLGIPSLVSAAGSYPTYGQFTNNGKIAYGIGTYGPCPYMISIYDTGVNGFQIESVDPKMHLTCECGFFTIAKVEDTKTYLSEFVYGKEYECMLEKDVTISVTPEYDESGNCVIMTYTMKNNGQDTKNINLSSFGWGMDPNETATQSNGGIHIRKDDAEFFVEPVDTAFDVRWLGKFYSDAYYNLKNYAATSASEIQGQCSLGWLWEFELNGGETTTRKVKLYMGPAYQVNFDANGGTGTMADQRFLRGIPSSLSENSFRRDGGYTFLGWSEDPDATSATYTDQSRFTATSASTLYAIWEAPAKATGTDPEAMELTYNGEAQNLVTEGSSEEGTYVYSLTGDNDFEEFIPQMTDAGSYDVYYQIKGDNTHSDSDIRCIQAEIKKADASFISKPSINKRTTLTTSGEIAFTGENVNLISVGRANGGTIVYSLDGKNFSESVPATDKTGDFTVYYKIAGDNNHNSTEVESLKITVMDYQIVEGKDASFTLTGSSALTIRVKRSTKDDTTIQHFSSIAVDGTVIPEDKYTKTPGSVIITIDSAYLKTLPAGNHTITVSFDDPFEVTTSLTIEKGAEPTPTPAPEPTATPAPTAAPTATPTPAEEKTLPKTGDVRNERILMASFILLTAGAVCITRVITSRRKEQN